MADFRFKQFTLRHDHSTMKIGTDAVLLAALTDVGNAHTLLDVGCGCGVIAFCMAQKMVQNCPSPQITGIDADAESIREASDNAQGFAMLPADAFHFTHTRLQEFTPADNGSFDLIVSNPPFFGNDLKPTDSNRRKSKHRDVQLPFQDLATHIQRLLRTTGRVALILPPVEGAEFDQIVTQRMVCTRRVFIAPNTRKPVHRVVQEYAWQTRTPYKEEHLTIRDGQNNLTPEYQSLMEPFLL